MEYEEEAALNHAEIMELRAEIERLRAELVAARKLLDELEYEQPDSETVRVLSESKWEKWLWVFIVVVGISAFICSFGQYLR